MREVVVITGANSLLAKKVSMILENKFEIRFLTTSRSLIDCKNIFIGTQAKIKLIKIV